ncbi:MAG: hypothetical protein H0V24_05465 [Chloroflexia bacterium]|nr:hypothetical protein [Chloroflexia bacterium]MDQ3413340.1 hypothetical protein [Chloroflexota bacterium]
MVISEPGLICLEASEYRVVRGFVSLWFGADDTLFGDPYTHHLRRPVGIGAGPCDPDQPVLPVAVRSEPAIGLEDGLSDETSELDAAEPLTAQERRARSAALRGLLLGRQRRYGAAQAAFADAARLDAGLSLESIPTFWNMERGAHEAAVRAYEEAGRRHDASVLASRLRTTFRPRLLTSRPA